MRMLITAVILMFMTGCTAMMVGGSAASYPPKDDCPEGQTRTENGCQT